MISDMRKRLSMLLSCLFLFVGIAVAQNTVTGTVVSGDDGDPDPALTAAHGVWRFGCIGAVRDAKGAAADQNPDFARD